MAARGIRDETHREPAGNREERLAKNEALFRQVNEQVAKVGQRFAADDEPLLGFLCECSQRGCGEVVQMSRADYEEIRSSPIRFFVVSGHEVPEAERIVSRRNGFLIVEKSEGEAEQVARETDPRD